MAKSHPSGAQPRSVHPLDHAVLPVVNLSAARSRLSALGFTVAPDALHPFGTENCCVFLADNTYLEPLAVAHRETCEAAALDGNVFVARDQAYRFRRGQDGFSGLVFASPDAAADDARFAKAGWSGGRMLEFSRRMTGSDGKGADASFKLSFAADLRSPDAFFVDMQRLNVPQIDRSKLLKHANGVVGMREIAMSEPNPSDFQYLLQDVTNSRDVEAHSFGIEIKAGPTNIAVYNRDGMQAWFGIDAASHARGLRLRAIVFAVGKLEKVTALLEKNGVAFREHAGRIVVDPAPGQGAVFAFEPKGRK